MSVVSLSHSIRSGEGKRHRSDQFSEETMMALWYQSNAARSRPHPAPIGHTLGIVDVAVRLSRHEGVIFPALL